MGNRILWQIVDKGKVFSYSTKELQQELDRIVHMLPVKNSDVTFTSPFSKMAYHVQQSYGKRNPYYHLRCALLFYKDLKHYGIPFEYVPFESWRDKAKVERFTMD